MKRLIFLFLIFLSVACTISENPNPEEGCLDGLEIIKNNANSEVITEDGYLKIKITNPQNIDDVVIRFTQEHPQADRDYFFELIPVLMDFTYEDGSTDLKSSHAAGASVSYDFDTTNPLIEVYASSRISNFSMEDFNRGFPRSIPTSSLDLSIQIQGENVTFNVGGNKFDRTWSGTELPDPLTTEIKLGVLPASNQNDKMTYAEYWIAYIKLEWWVNSEKDFSYPFDDC
jgi:hypothetical protein